MKKLPERLFLFDLPMKTLYYSISILFVFIACQTDQTIYKSVDTILINEDHLKRNRTRLEQNSLKLRDSFIQLLKEAEIAMNEGPFSVTHKKKLPPSGDFHDYVSYSRYWWPDTSQPDGLPYKRRDGETNPDSQSSHLSDRPRIGKFGKNAETLGLAYYFTGEQKYAQKAAQLLRAWFLNKGTKMNPNMNHAQCRLGHNEGSKSGVLDGRLMIGAFESSLLIADSQEFSESEMFQLKEWASEYLNWLTTNKLALEEAKSKNNHGSFYDVQLMYFALFSGDKVLATKVANGFLKKRAILQILPDGSMPEELARTRPLFYSIYNLHALFLVAHMAESLEIDLWKKTTEIPD